MTTSLFPSNLTHFLPTYWQQIITPCFSLLADECGVSVMAVERSTPHLLTAIYYQLIKTAQTPPSPATNPTTQINFLLDKFFSTHFPASELKDNGFDFYHISQLRPKIDTIESAFFPQEQIVYLITGVVAARTQVAVSRLHQLGKWLTFLALKITASLLTSSATPIHNFIAWLPHSLPNNEAKDSTLLEAIHFYTPSQVVTFFKSALPEVENWLVKNQQILLDYSHLNPMGIIPLRQQTPADSKQISLTPLPHNAPIKSKAIDIFSPTDASQTHHKQPFSKTLQTHWMAFTVGLSALVIGGIGAISATTKTSTDSTKADIKATDIPHDVAIVRTASTTQLAQNVAPSNNKTPTARKTSSSVVSLSATHTTKKDSLAKGNKDNKAISTKKIANTSDKATPSSSHKTNQSKSNKSSNKTASNSNTGSKSNLNSKNNTKDSISKSHLKKTTKSDDDD